MSKVNSLVDTLENFYICTYIPIRAYKADGTLVHSAGYDERLNKLFDSSELYGKAKAALLRQVDHTLGTITFADNIRFVASTVCACRIDEGFFVIGPYVPERLEGSSIVYKPENCIPHIISLLHSIYRAVSFPEIKAVQDKEPCSFYVKKAVDFINENFQEPISLEDVSKHLEINKCYFCSLFKSEIGKTYSQYLNELRIGKSKELILKDNLSLLDVALAVGFNNQNYFNMTFKKLIGMTPLEFRNKG